MLTHGVRRTGWGGPGADGDSLASGQWAQSKEQQPRTALGTQEGLGKLG